MTAQIARFADTCPACRDGLHTHCREWLATLFGGNAKGCKCLPQCRDQHGELTEAALVEMARRHPEALARHIRVVSAVDHGSLGIHLTRVRRRSAP